METFKQSARDCSQTSSGGPHSLGQSVEWKHVRLDPRSLGDCLGPTRWGNQLNGNKYRVEDPFENTIEIGPHSLGQSVEWKLLLAFQLKPNDYRPHSLGQSVEWKLAFHRVRRDHCVGVGPTRWGNQLNGNPTIRMLVT